MSKQNPDLKYTLSELADILSASLHVGNTDVNQKITGLATLKKADNHHLSFFTNTRYREDLLNSKAGVIITSAKHKDLVKTAALVVRNPHHAYALLTKLFLKQPENKSEIHHTAIIGNNCKIAKTASIGAYVVIGDNVTIADGVIIKSGCSIGDNCSIGANSLFYNRVTLYSNVQLGANCIIHSGAVIGSDGFGFALADDKSWTKVEQLGGVTIGNDVEIGANTTIDCGALEDTVIADGVKIDNQIQVGHNVFIDQHSIFAANTAIAGSSKIGKHCGIGGASVIAGHIELSDGVNLAGACVAAKSISEPGIYASGTGSVVPFNKWRRLIVNFANLDKYIAQIKCKSVKQNKSEVPEVSEVID